MGQEQQQGCPPRVQGASRLEPGTLVYEAVLPSCGLKSAASQCSWARLRGPECSVRAPAKGAAQ